MHLGFSYTLLCTLSKYLHNHRLPHSYPTHELQILEKCYKQYQYCQEIIFLTIPTKKDRVQISQKHPSRPNLNIYHQLKKFLYLQESLYNPYILNLHIFQKHLDQKIPIVFEELILFLFLIALLILQNYLNLHQVSPSCTPIIF